MQRHSASRASPAVLVSIAALLSVALPQVVRANDPCVERAGSARTIDLTMWAARPDARWVAEVIDELLDRLEVRVCRTAPRRISARELSEPPAQPEPALARVILARAPRWITVYVVDGPWERVLLRQVDLGEAGLDEVAREQIGHIVLGTIEALLAGQRIGVPRSEIARQAEPIAAPPAQRAPPEPPAPAPPPPIAPGGSGDDRLGIGLGYTARLQGTETPVAHEASVALLVPFGRGLAPFAGLRVAYRFASRVSSQDVGVNVTGIGGRVSGGLRVPLEPSTRLQLAAGVGIERTRAVSFDPAPDIAPAGPVAKWFPRLSLEIGLERALASSLALLLMLEAQIDPVDERYVVRDRDDVDVVADPWRVRPAATLALVWRP